jgi:hypothetical protein
MAQVDKATKVSCSIVANRLKGDGTAPKYIHWGTGNTAATIDDTALQTPRAESRVAGTETIVTTTVTNDTYQVVGTITCAGTAAAITEFGQFDAASGGNILVRSTFDVINLQVGDSIQFTSKFKSGVS